jgi:hypothetical protein
MAVDATASTVSKRNLRIIDEDLVSAWEKVETMIVGEQREVTWKN